MEQVVGDVLDKVQPTGQMELIADLAFPLAVKVMALMLGVPAADLVRFRGWALAIDLVLEPVNLISPEVFREGDRVIGELTEYFRSLAAQRRQEPRDDLLSALVEVEAEGKRLNTDELLAMCILILFAGHASTVNLIGNGTLALLRHPDQWALLRSNPDLIKSAVEELLRYDSSIQVARRIAMEELEIGGQKVRKDQEVFLLLGAANRDPEQFPDPDRLDITRADNGHLAFGDGVHYCLGAPLVRAEAQVAFAALVKRMPNLKLATDMLEYQQTVSFRGVKAMPVTF
jgi:cytochrome P450